MASEVAEWSSKCLWLTRNQPLLGPQAASQGLFDSGNRTWCAQSHKLPDDNKETHDKLGMDTSSGPTSLSSINFCTSLRKGVDISSCVLESQYVLSVPHDMCSTTVCKLHWNSIVHQGYNVSYKNGHLLAWFENPDGLLRTAFTLIHGGEWLVLTNVIVFIQPWTRCVY